MSYVNEKDLIEAIRKGDHTAFEQLIYRTRPKLLSYCSNIVRSDDIAEDIVQDVYAAQWIRRKHWKLRRSLMSYLRRAVWHRSIDVLRSLRKEREMAYQLPLPPPPEESDQSVLSLDLEIMILNLSQKLPLRCRQVFLTCAISEWPILKTAKALEIKPSTVNYYLVLARKEMLKMLGESGIDLLPRDLRNKVISSTEDDENHTNIHMGYSARNGDSDVEIMIDFDKHTSSETFSSVTEIRLRKRGKIVKSEHRVANPERSF